MVSPAASCPRTALTVNRVSRMQGRPLIRFGSIEICSHATPEAYVDRSPAAQRTAAARPSPSARRSMANTSTGARAHNAEYSRRRRRSTGEETASGSSSSVSVKGRDLSDFRNWRRARPHCAQRLTGHACRQPRHRRRCRTMQLLSGWLVAGGALLAAAPGPLDRSHGPGRRAGRTICLRPASSGKWGGVFLADGSRRGEGAG